MELRDCMLLSTNSATSGDVAQIGLTALIRLIGCTILGDYGADVCIFNDEDDSSSFEFYYTKAFESGVVCSVVPMLIYNTEVTLPLSHDAATVTCQTEGIIDYCAFDCSSGNAEDNGGITCR